MDEISLPHMRKEELWQSVILVATESERRKIAMAELIIELFSSIFNFPEKYPLDEKCTPNSTKNENQLQNSKKDKIEPITYEQDFTQRKWKMYAKSKL